MQIGEYQLHRDQAIQYRSTDCSPICSHMHTAYQRWDVKPQNEKQQIDTTKQHVEHMLQYGQRHNYIQTDMHITTLDMECLPHHQLESNDAHIHEAYTPCLPNNTAPHNTS